MLLETFTTGYETLFQVQILHRYFLNVGTTAFDAAAPLPAVQPALAAARRAYAVQPFWRLMPDAATQEALRNARLLFKLLPDGFRVGVPTDGGHHPVVPLPDELDLNFLVYSTDPFFALYTDIDRAVLDAFQPTPAAPQGQVFGWTNTAGSSVLNAHETIQLADLRPRPAGSGAGGPPLGIIEIRHRPAGGPSLLDGAGQVLRPVFTAVLRNRSTRWEYQGADVGLFPLVRAGRLAASGGNPVRPLPNPTPATTADRGAAFVSVIY
ncbi:hypothetical protein [Hymenobacter terricola]|uniref:hypothetical protein n=1 Tax=Hymenobacter terricola TaxID=2819236 RepID=UPI001B30916B|nr:hypothetical protein [Hymenobacter terricola]